MYLIPFWSPSLHLVTWVQSQEAVLRRASVPFKPKTNKASTPCKRHDWEKKTTKAILSLLPYECTDCYHKPYLVNCLRRRQWILNLKTCHNLFLRVNQQEGLCIHQEIWTRIFLSIMFTEDLKKPHCGYRYPQENEYRLQGHENEQIATTFVCYKKRNGFQKLYWDCIWITSKKKSDINWCREQFCLCEV